MRLFSAFLVCAAALLALAPTPRAAAQPAPAARPVSGKIIQPVLAGWRFRQAGKGNWAPATVPGCVHTDLLAAKQIEDPLYRDNELKLQWIGKTNWEYETTFDVAAATWQRQYPELVFKGLDTYADVTLNGTAILHADNMFREWRAQVKPQLNNRRGGPHHAAGAPAQALRKAGLPTRREPRADLHHSASTRPELPRRQRPAPA